MSRRYVVCLALLGLTPQVLSHGAPATSVFSRNPQVDSSVSVWPQPQSMASSCSDPQNFMHFEEPAVFNFEGVPREGIRTLEDFLDAHIKPYMFPRHFMHTSSGKTVELGKLGREPLQGLGAKGETPPAPPTIRYNISNASAAVDFGIDESYEIVMKGAEWNITAATQVGALYATDTLSQLMLSTFFHDPSGAYRPIYRAPSSCTIQDAPRFPWRGLLLDVGRHWQPPSAILGTILPAMRLNKLNVLHLHMTEDQSFPLMSFEHPELAFFGAFSPPETYSPPMLRLLVEEAKTMGIRVVPEYDMPGHSTSVRWSHPEVFACTEQESARGAYDPTKNETYAFLQGLLEEFSGSGGKHFAAPFTDSFVHLGTDEVPTDCWKTIKQDPNALFGEFIQRMGRFVIGSSGDGLGTKKAGLGKTPIMWDESIGAGAGNLPPKQTVIQIWRNWTAGQDAVTAAVKLGYRAIVSLDYAGYMNWYLDGGTAWDDRMYTADPVPSGGLTPEQEKMVLGGEGAMWGEKVDLSDLVSTIFPRMSAIAERLWSAKEVNDVEMARPRLQKFRCLMVFQGIAAEPVGGKGRTAPGGPGSCMQLLGGGPHGAAAVEVDARSARRLRADGIVRHGGGGSTSTGQEATTATSFIL